MSGNSADATDREVGRIHCEDCIRGMRSIPAGSVDLVVADPPFNIGYEYDVYDDERAADEYLGWSADWMEEVWRVLHENGTFWLAIGDEFTAELKVAATQIGFHTRSWIVWYYTFGVNCKNKFTRSHTHLLYFVKNPREFTFCSDDPRNRVPSARQLVYNDRRANSKGRLPDDTWIIPPAVDQTFVLRPQDLQQQFQAEEDTWYFPRVAGTFRERAGFHGCQMPEQLLGRIIRSCSKEDDIVLDPFAGSASTLIVAKKLLRRFVGFELSGEYTRAGTERLEATRPGDELIGAPEPTMSAKRTPGLTTSGPPTASDIQRPAARVAPEFGIHKPESGNRKGASPLSEPPISLARRLSRLIDETITAAFMETHDGYAADRMLADPDLQAAFHEECSRHGLPMTPRTACLHLLKLRKRGGALKGTKRYSVSAADCEPYLFATEIAWRRVHDKHPDASLEEILADPGLAAEYDSVARRFAPGYTSLQYRWAALRLRKSLEVARRKGRSLRAPRRRWLESKFSQFRGSDAADQPGIWFVWRKDVCLYVGGALSLRDRLRQIIAKPSAHWSRARRDLRIEYFVTPGKRNDLLSWVSCVVSSLDELPRFNIPELRAG